MSRVNPSKKRSGLVYADIYVLHQFSDTHSEVVRTGRRWMRPMEAQHYANLHAAYTEFQAQRNEVVAEESLTYGEPFITPKKLRIAAIVLVLLFVAAAVFMN